METEFVINILNLNALKSAYKVFFAFGYTYFYLQYKGIGQTLNVCLRHYVDYILF